MADYFAQIRPELKQNMLESYEFILENDVPLTHALLNLLSLATHAHGCGLAVPKFETTQVMSLMLTTPSPFCPRTGLGHRACPALSSRTKPPWL